MVSGGDSSFFFMSPKILFLFLFWVVWSDFVSEWLAGRNGIGFLQSSLWRDSFWTMSFWRFLRFLKKKEWVALAAFQFLFISKMNKNFLKRKSKCFKLWLSSLKIKIRLEDFLIPIFWPWISFRKKDCLT